MLIVLARTPGRLWSRPLVRAGAAILLPVLVVAAVLYVAVGERLDYYHDNSTGFVKFGADFARYTHPPRGAVIGRLGSVEGYDGQFYYVIARDPLLVHNSTVASLVGAPQNIRHKIFGSTNQAYRFLRVAYPALSYLLAEGLGISTATAMLSANVAIVLLLTGGFAAYLRRRGWSSLWALALGLLPGMLLATRRDLADPLATAAVLGGVLSWTSGQRRWGVGFLIIAVLAREVMVAAVVGLAVEAGYRAWRERSTPGAARRVLLEVWPAVILPAAVWVGWHVYVNLRVGGFVGGAGVTFPFGNFVSELESISDSDLGMAVWEAGYMVLMIAGALAALLSLRRGISVINVVAALFALSVLVAPFNDEWGNARDSLPLLALLLVIALEHRERAWLGICLAAAGWTALIPLGVPGPF